jgi:hypothetical protein
MRSYPSSGLFCSELLIFNPSNGGSFDVLKENVRCDEG